MRQSLSTMIYQCAAREYVLVYVNKSPVNEISKKTHKALQIYVVITFIVFEWKLIFESNR